MSSDNLKRLSLKLLATPLVDGGNVYIPGKNYHEITMRLPEVLRQDVNQLVENVGSIIPNDFPFWFFFSVYGANLTAEFEDGNTSSSAGDWLFTSKKSMLRKMRSINWDVLRAELIESGSAFEDLTNEAADRPANIPSSREAAEKFSSELASIFADLKRATKTVPFIMVIAREDEGVEVNDYDSRASLTHEISDVVATGYDILAIVENGTAWTFEKIEAIKLEVIEGLGPISRAKAERRLSF